jgi:hypothetical protein
VGQHVVGALQPMPLWPRGWRWSAPQGTCRLPPWKVACVKIFTDSVHTAKKTPHFTVTKISWLTLFKEIIADYSENHLKHMNTK